MLELKIEYKTKDKLRFLDEDAITYIGWLEGFLPKEKIKSSESRIIHDVKTRYF